MNNNFLPFSSEYVDHIKNEVEEVVFSSKVNDKEEKETETVMVNIDLTFLVTYIFAKTSFLHKDIDELYQKKPIQYYKHVKNSPFYNALSYQQMTLFEQITYRKVLGMFEYTRSGEADEKETNELLTNIHNYLKKGYRKIYLLFKDKKEVNLLKIMKYIDDTYSSPQESAHNICRYFAAYVFAIQLSFDIGEERIGNLEAVTEIIYAAINSEMVMIEKPELNTKNIIMDSKIKKLFDNKFFVCIQGMYLLGEEFQNSNEYELCTFVKFAPDLKDDFYFQLRVLDRIFAMEEVDKTSLISKYEFNKKDMEEMLSLIQTFGNIKQDKEYVPLMVAATYIRSLIRAYKDTREAYFTNSKEVLFQELELLQEENKKIRIELTQEKDKNKILASKVEEFKNNNPYEKELLQLKRENEKLQKELKFAHLDKQELYKLREFAFALEQEQNEKEEIIDVRLIKSELEQIKGVIVGGHTNWQKKMKEVLDWSYIPANVKISKNVIADFDVFVVNFAHFNHSSYTPLIEYIRNNNKNIIYVNDTNVEKSLNTIFTQIKRG